MGVPANLIEKISYSIFRIRACSSALKSPILFSTEEKNRDKLVSLAAGATADATPPPPIDHMFVHARLPREP